MLEWRYKHRILMLVCHRIMFKRSASLLRLLITFKNMLLELSNHEKFINGIVEFYQKESDIINILKNERYYTVRTGIKPYVDAVMSEKK